ncbi:MAG: hypothetical protein IPK82_42850 [Polyangiaceae bacterium]|nr:hypothetical protein [Polyangiaceae bacterium]
MKKTNILLGLFFGSLMLFGAAGCGKSKALVAAEEYEKAACACKDAACATEASKAFAAKAQDMATASGGEAEAITKATTAAAACVTKASMAGVPGMPGAK